MERGERRSAGERKEVWRVNAAREEFKVETGVTKAEVSILDFGRVCDALSVLVATRSRMGEAKFRERVKS